MTMERVHRRLVAILAADVVGFSALVERDEGGTLAALRQCRAEVIEPVIAGHGGRVFKHTGDGLLAEFLSAVDAVQCAVELQRRMADRNALLPEARRLVLRVGVNLGDVVVEGDDLYGEGVNVAARLEALAEPGGVLISAGTAAHVRNKVAARFEDLGPRQLKNIAEPVHLFSVVAAGEAPAAAAPAAPRATRAPAALRASLAVLPFANLGGDPEQAYFADGVVEDIITELSRFRSLFVIARNSSFAFRGQPIGVDEIARRLGVQYVLEGSVRRAGSRVRISAQLIDAASGAHLWAERFDRELADIFEVQDEVVRTVAATVAGRVQVAGAEVARRKPPESLAAYDLVLRGIEQLNLEGAEHNAEARRLFAMSVERDPDYAAGHTYLALATYIEWRASRAEGELESALAMARRALELDENDSRCHRVLDMIYSRLGEFEKAEFHSGRSIELNPNDPLAALYRAMLMRALGRDAEAVEWAEKAMRLNPYHPNWYWNVYAVGLQAAGRWREALDAYAQMVDRPRFYHAYVAACHARLGRTEEARRHAAKALEAMPEFRVGAWGRELVYRDDADRQRFMDSFRQAGLPD